MTVSSSQPQAQPLAPDGLSRAEYKRTTHSITLPDGVPLEAVLDSKFWCHVSRQLSLRDRIEVSDEKLTFCAELLVTDKGDADKNDNWAKVKLLWKTDLEHIAVNDADVPAGYEVKWSGPKVRWAVLRASDGFRLWQSEAGKNERADAVAWAMNHAQRIAA